MISLGREEGNLRPRLFDAPPAVVPRDSKQRRAREFLLPGCNEARQRAREREGKAEKGICGFDGCARVYGYEDSSFSFFLVQGGCAFLRGRGLRMMLFPDSFGRVLGMEIDFARMRGLIQT